MIIKPSINLVATATVRYLIKHLICDYIMCNNSNNLLLGTKLLFTRIWLMIKHLLQCRNYIEIIC